MKKLIALLLLFSSPVYALSDCADKPTCEEIGYTHNEYACDQKIAMPCPFDSSKIYCPGPVCEPGYFLYSDGSCSLALKSDKTVIGIVFDKEWRLAVSVEPAQSLQWANNAEETLDENGQETIVVPDLFGGEGAGYETVCKSYCNGRENTKIIIDYAKANNYVFPAAEYCYNFEAEGKGKGNWWLPSKAEIWKFQHAIDTVYDALAKYGITERPYIVYWLSQQNNVGGNSTALGMMQNVSSYDGKGATGWYSKRNKATTICITRY